MSTTPEHQTALSAENFGPPTGAELLATIRQLGEDLKIRSSQLESLTLNSSFDKELGLDSLTRVEFLTRIERQFQIALPQQIFADVDTPKDLLREISRANASRKDTLLTEIAELDSTEILSAPHRAETLLDVLDWHLETHPDRPHIRFYSDSDEGEIISYRQLKQGADAIAVGLQQKGLKPKQAVSLMLPTGKEYFFSFFGILIAGGIPVPIYPPARLNQIEDHLLRHVRILSNCDAVMLITVPEAKQVARLLQSRLMNMHTVTTPTAISLPGGVPLRGKISSDEIAFLQYTSGSTGTPKGVTLSHANLLANIRAMGSRLEVTSTDVFVSWLPLYHDMGLIGAWLGSLYYSATVVIMSPLEFLAKPERWLWAMHRYHATLTAAPNFAFELCLKRIPIESLSGVKLDSMRGLFNGAEPVNPNTIQKFIQKFQPLNLNPAAIMPVYGLAECSVGLTFPPLGRGAKFDSIDRTTFMNTGVAVTSEDENNPFRFVACGEPIADHEIRVVDGSNRELPDRHQGQLQFRGPSATCGYYRNPEKSAELFHEGWLNTGDLAYIADGELYITGRIKDLIIHAGRNIYPQELEAVVSEIPGIRKGCVAIFGSTDNELGTEKLIVLAETRDTQATEQDRLRTQINECAIRLIGTPPDEIVIAPPHSVLKTSSGKIRRSACREAYEKNLIGSGPGSAAVQIIRLLIASTIPQLGKTLAAVKSTLYALYAWLIFVPLIAFGWIAVVGCPVFPWRRRIIRTVIKFLSISTGTLVNVEGLENLPDDGQTRIIICNHCSYLDSAILLLTLPTQFAFVAKGELANQLIAGTFLRRIEAEFVERFQKQQGVSDADKIAGAARRGKTLLFYPEGTFTRVPGLLPFYMGAFKTAAELGLPVVPVVIRGTRSILRPDTWFPRHGTISVTITQALDPKDYSRTESGLDGVWDTAEKLKQASRVAMLQHVNEPDLTR